jgi:hypothetical protein
VPIIAVGAYVKERVPIIAVGAYVKERLDLFVTAKLLHVLVFDV